MKIQNLLVSPELEASFKRLRETIERIRNDAPLIEKAISALDSDVAKALEQDASKEPLTRRSAYFATLWTQHGWFLSGWETPLYLLNYTARLLGTSRHEEAQGFIAQHFDDRFEKSIEEISKQHPDRAAILGEVLSAHRNGNFALAIPVMLIQADGIASEHFGLDSIYSFSNRNFTLIQAKLDNGVGLSLASMHFLIAVLTPLNASFKRRERYLDPFNRHLVIHGAATDYATRINSLKALSWLYFVHEAVLG